jgi:hypothetical protein
VYVVGLGRVRVRFCILVQLTRGKDVKHFKVLCAVSCFFHVFWKHPSIHKENSKGRRLLKQLGSFKLLVIQIINMTNNMLGRVALYKFIHFCCLN